MVEKREPAWARWIFSEFEEFVGIRVSTNLQKFVEIRKNADVHILLGSIFCPVKRRLFLWQLYCAGDRGGGSRGIILDDFVCNIRLHHRVNSTKNLQ